MGQWKTSMAITQQHPLPEAVAIKKESSGTRVPDGVNVSIEHGEIPGGIGETGAGAAFAVVGHECEVEYGKTAGGYARRACSGPGWRRDIVKDQICTRVFDTLDAIEEKLTEALRPYWEKPIYARSLVGDG